jgi:hypothetical protein
VRALAGEANDVALDAVGTEHGGQGEAQPLEHRPLLDVKLEIRSSVCQFTACFPGAVEVDAVESQHIGQRCSVGVAENAELIGVEAARSCARAEQAAAEAEPLLVGPVDEPDGRLRPTLLSDPAQDLEPREHVQAAVEPASVGDGVEMSAHQDCAVRVAGQRRPEIAGLVHFDLHRQVLELLPEPAAGEGPPLRPTNPLRAVRVAGQRVQLLQLDDRPSRIEHPPTVGDTVAAWISYHGLSRPADRFPRSRRGRSL